jgi:hypothetical protein
MKTERRHELQENELANWLAEKLDWLRPYSKAILGVLLLAVVALMVVSYMRGRSERMREAGWAAYFEAMAGRSPEAFEEVANTYPGTSAAGWAMQRAADLYLDESLQQLFQDRDAAQQSVDAARELYQKILDTSNDPMLEQRATYGLAKCLEARGDFEEAKAHYEQVASRWSDSTFAALARERVNRIEQPATRQWYHWFAEQKPVRSPLTDPGMFPDLPDLPDSPNLQMPPAGQLLPGSSSGSVAPADSTPPASAPDLGLDLPAATGSSGSLGLDFGPESATPPQSGTGSGTPDVESSPPDAPATNQQLPQDAGADSDSEVNTDQNTPGVEIPTP